MHLEEMMIICEQEAIALNEARKKSSREFEKQQFDVYEKPSIKPNIEQLNAYQAKVISGEMNSSTTSFKYETVGDEFMEKAIADKSNLKLFLRTNESGAGLSNSLSNSINQINNTSSSNQLYYVEYDEQTQTIRLIKASYI